LPTKPNGEELPYATAVNRRTGDVWITGSNSNTLIRFRPDTEEFTVFPLPTASDFTREIEFGDDDSVWTCTSNQEIGPDTPGTGRIIQLVVRERQGLCGDGVIQLGEDCDDGNTTGCDGCSSDCRDETGCGDGVTCGEEECDDGNDSDCDGCSSACRAEIGTQCGDGVSNEQCGEECDPPGMSCTDECQRVPVCGDGLTDSPEECDDSNTANCDGCSAGCRIETGCGDGAQCDDEECDDGNQLDCDGCSSACTVEVGSVCGDGVVSSECGEECDPPGEGCSVICTDGDGVLGTRVMTITGPFFSSPLGTSTPLGELEGTLELVGGVIDADGIAPVDVSGPTYYSAPILNGQFGLLCIRVDSCSGFIDCDGGSAVDSLMVQDSNGPGLNGLGVTITTGLGEAGPAGTMQLDCMQTYVQLGPGEGDDCQAIDYPAVQRIIYTTGTAEAFFINGAPKIGTGRIVGSGEPFSCSSWTVSDGPGRLASTYLVEEEPRAGDVANLNVLGD
jgi:cysteine-rich repeat protein